MKKFVRENQKPLSLIISMIISIVCFELEIITKQFTFSNFLIASVSIYLFVSSLANSPLLNPFAWSNEEKLPKLSIKQFLSRVWIRWAFVVLLIMFWPTQINSGIIHLGYAGLTAYIVCIQMSRFFYELLKSTIHTNSFWILNSENIPKEFQQVSLN